MFVAVFVVSSVACGGGLFTHHRIGIEQATVFTCLDHGHGAERGRVRDCDAEVVSEQIVDVFFLARLQLVFRHTSPAREPRAAWVSREMCVGVILTPADEQDDQDDLGTAGVSNVIVFVHVCGVDVVRVRVCRCNPCRVCRQRFGELGGRCSGGAPRPKTRTATLVLSGFPVTGAPLPARPAGRGRGRFARADVFLVATGGAEQRPRGVARRNRRSAIGDEIQSGVVSEAAFVFRCAATRVRNHTFRVVLALRRALATALERCDAKLDRGRRCPVERGSFCSRQAHANIAALTPYKMRWREEALELSVVHGEHAFVWLLGRFPTVSVFVVWLELFIEVQLNEVMVTAL